MAAFLPPGAQRPGGNNSNQPLSSQQHPPHPNYSNPNALADNLQNMNLNRPDTAPRPSPFGQPPPPFSSTAPSTGYRPGSQQMARPGPPPPTMITRPVGPPSRAPPGVAPGRPMGPPGSHPPFASSLPSSMASHVGPSFRPTASAGGPVTLPAPTGIGAPPLTTGIVTPMPVGPTQAGLVSVGQPGAAGPRLGPPVGISSQQHPPAPAGAPPLTATSSTLAPSQVPSMRTFMAGPPPTAMQAPPTFPAQSHQATTQPPVPPFAAQPWQLRPAQVS